MQNTFYSNGKLLITAEYLVLKGAIALALPTKKGQYLEVFPRNDNKIYWKSYDSDGNIWLETILDLHDILNLKKTNDSIQNQLILILHYANIQARFLDKNGFDIITKLTFPRNWGLGSSSTLINNLAQWQPIDAYQLLQNTFGGSGYDLACAAHNFPITFQLKEDSKLIKKVDFNPIFKENIYFLYLNQKQNSGKAIASFYQKNNPFELEIEQCNLLTHQIIECNDYEEFKKLIIKHEILMQDVLETKTVKELYFNDFDGVVKSLGAWGGDFCMIISDENPAKYFKEKGFETIISYEDMIL